MCCALSEETSLLYETYIRWGEEFAGVIMDGSISGGDTFPTVYLFYISRNIKPIGNGEETCFHLCLLETAVKY